MSVNALSAMKAYGKAIEETRRAGFAQTSLRAPAKSAGTTSFSDTLSDSLKKVNDLQQEKSSMIQSFASGESANVHELMIGLQKAGMAMNMTSAVRNKIMTAYQEIMKMPF